MSGREVEVEGPKLLSESSPALDLDQSSAAVVLPCMQADFTGFPTSY